MLRTQPLVEGRLGKLNTSILRLYHRGREGRAMGCLSGQQSAMSAPGTFQGAASERRRRGCVPASTLFTCSVLTSRLYSCRKKACDLVLHWGLITCSRSQFALVVDCFPSCCDSRRYQASAELKMDISSWVHFIDLGTGGKLHC